MDAAWASTAVALLGAYAAIGALFAVAFHVRGIARVDRTAAAGTLGFRLVITPGVVAFWPLLARRWWIGAGEPPEPRDAHRDAACAEPGS